MLPKLYDSFDISISGHGATNYLGTITQCLKCLVKEDRNGEYTLELETTVNDPAADLIISQRIIKIKPNPHDPEQCFEIQTTARTLNGTVKVTAKHIRSFAFNLESLGDVDYTDVVNSYSLTPAGVWNKLFNESFITESCPFDFYSDISSTADFYLGFNEPILLGDILGGKEGSMIDMYGGEFYYSNYNIRYYQNRGKYTGYALRFGQNITSADQTEGCTQTYSHVRPYGQVSTTDGRYINLYADKFEIPNNECKTRKVFLLDCSEAVKTMQVGHAGTGYSEVRAAMTAFAQQYVSANRIGKTNVSITVGVRALLDDMKTLALCDEIRVIIDEFGLSTRAKIVSATYDALLERWEQLTIGGIPVTLADVILNRKRYNL